MRRFFCTVCKQVKRVQNWPIRLDNHGSRDVTQRIGECDAHYRAPRSQSEPRMKRISASKRDVA